MSKKLITSCMIGDYKYKIYDVDMDENILDINEGNIGTTLHLKKEIYIYQDLDKKTKSNILKHELSHAFLYETQIIHREEYNEEELCEFVARFASEICTIATEYLQILN